MNIKKIIIGAVILVILFLVFEQKDKYYDTRAVELVEKYVAYRYGDNVEFVELKHYGSREIKYRTKDEKQVEFVIEIRPNFSPEIYNDNFYHELWRTEESIVICEDTTLEEFQKMVEEKIREVNEQYEKYLAAYEPDDTVPEYISNFIVEERKVLGLFGYLGIRSQDGQILGAINSRNYYIIYIPDEVEKAFYEAKEKLSEKS